MVDPEEGRSERPTWTENPSVGTPTGWVMKKWKGPKSVSDLKHVGLQLLNLPSSSDWRFQADHPMVEH